MRAQKLIESYDELSEGKKSPAEIVRDYTDKHGDKAASVLARVVARGKSGPEYARALKHFQDKKNTDSPLLNDARKSLHRLDPDIGSIMKGTPRKLINDFSTRARKINDTKGKKEAEEFLRQVATHINKRAINAIADVKKTHGEETANNMRKELSGKVQDFFKAMEKKSNL